MLSRRLFLTLALGVASASACGDRTTAISKPSLQTVYVDLPPRQTDELMRRLSAFAHDDGFQMYTRAIPSRIGTRWTFELRREDLWIEGLNPLKDIPSEMPMPASGKPGPPPMEINSGKFVVDFYRGDVEPTASALNATITAFIASAESVEGVAVTRAEETPRRP
jgi:hypothetical protein